MRAFNQTKMKEYISPKVIFYNSFTFATKNGETRIYKDKVFVGGTVNDGTNNNSEEKAKRKIDSGWFNKPIHLRK